MDEQWTLADLVAQVEQHLAALPAPKNGQVRAVPDDRTIRYYGTIGLLDRPLAMRGRTALYGKKHVAQVVAIKRLQNLGRSLAEIQASWPTLDDATLARMSGVALPVAAPAPVRRDFWKHEIVAAPEPLEPAPLPHIPSQPVPIELRIQLAVGAHLAITVPDAGVAITPADLRAIRDAAASLVTELASRHLTPNNEEQR